MLKELAELNIPKRAFLAGQLGLLSSKVVDNIRAVNRVRNKLVHFKPKSKGDGWEIGTIPEIANKDSFEECKENAIRAIKELAKSFKS